jgi:hypothetical protein
MAVDRYQSPIFIIEFAARMESELDAVIRTRMLQVGIPEDMIGFRGVPGFDDGRAFVRFPQTQIGGNLNPAVSPALSRGIALDHGILDVAHPAMNNVPAWSQDTTTLRDRADAAIAHEYVEATLIPFRSLIGRARIKWLHNEAIRHAPDIILPTTERAREILRQYRGTAGLAP